MMMCHVIAKKEQHKRTKEGYLLLCTQVVQSEIWARGLLLLRHLSGVSQTVVTKSVMDDGLTQPTECSHAQAEPARQHSRILLFMYRRTMDRQIAADITQLFLQFTCQTPRGNLVEIHEGSLLCKFSLFTLSVEYCSCLWELTKILRIDCVWTSHPS